MSFPTNKIAWEGRFPTYSLIDYRACSHSVVHSNFPSYFNTLKKGSYFSAAFHRKYTKAASHPVSAWTSLAFFDEWISVKIEVFLGLDLSPLCETMWLRSFPYFTSNVHFMGFNLRPTLFRVHRVCSRSLEKSAILLLLMMMSSIYFYILPYLSHEDLVH